MYILNKRVEGEHRFVKMANATHAQGFKSFGYASRTLTGIEMVRMIQKEQVALPKATAYQTFCSQAA